MRAGGTRLPEHITQTDQWHPKLTPYRLLVLLTTVTVGLGTAKAYSVSRQSVSVATSIEWISGVVIFSMLSSKYAAVAVDSHNSSF